jgi:hypothetical protein
LGVTSVGVTFIASFVKVGQQVQNVIPTKHVEKKGKKERKKEKMMLWFAADCGK